MPEFVLNRNHNLQLKGFNIRFEKGQPTYVPPELVRAAVGIGAEPLEGDRPDALPPEEMPEEQLTDADKLAMIFAAFDQLTSRNDREDFDGAGKPSVDAVKKIVSFSLTRKERDGAWQQYREAAAAKADQ